jgi:transcriptional regulator with XRE-family HTH domain
VHDRLAHAAPRRSSPAGAPGPRPTPAQQIGLFLRATREAQNLNQEQLAALTSRRPGRVSRAMISAVERGRHLPGLEVLLTLSRVLHVSPTEVLERLELARGEPIDATGKTFEELDRQASESFWAGEPRRAAACYDAMLRQLRDEPPDDASERRRRTATTELRRGAALRRCGAPTAARGSIERAITLSDAMPEIQAQGYLVLAALLVQLGKLPLARDAAERALQITDGLNDPQLQGWGWIEMGEVLAASGRYADARDAFLQARKCVRAADDVHHAIKVEGNIGQCLHELGRHDLARRRYVRATGTASPI